MMGTGLSDTPTANESTCWIAWATAPLCSPVGRARVTRARVIAARMFGRFSFFVR